MDEVVKALDSIRRAWRRLKWDLNGTFVMPMNLQSLERVEELLRRHLPVVSTASFISLYIANGISKLEGLRTVVKDSFKDM
jgi:hypothetical protein